LNIVFLGSDPIALPLLDWLAGPGAADTRIAAIFTQPDRPVGRGQKVTANAIKQWARAHAVPVHQPEKLTPQAKGELAAMAPDLALVMAYGHILRQEFIDTPRLGTLNFHASLLPKYRGASPIQTAVASGETVTGVSLMRIVRELDAGPVADREQIAIGALDTALEIEGKLAAACVTLLARNLPALAAGGLPFAEQDHTCATFCRRLTKADGGLDFSRPAAELARRINGLYPWPACTVAMAGQQVKLGGADAMAGTAEPGLVAGADAAGLLVGTGAGLLRLRRLQRPGGRMLPAGEFLRGFALAPGLRLPSATMSPLVAAAPFRR
jgi:methionyl-tRNA formyltransferase